VAHTIGYWLSIDSARRRRFSTRATCAPPGRPDWVLRKPPAKLNTSNDE
jgi:hypothetical protein